ncbi:MAG: hypothetical protein JRN62_03395 [Nitrososphaerota archaeon]|jgi:hypothetical protein|nr:hypothetical protein [Nitrososphaerota archaeon]MDG6948643.1 hypothetical protein [Nitrososphaerota archaeon]
MNFVGTEKIKQLVYASNTDKSRLKEINDALELQQNILSMASGVQVVSEALLLANKAKDNTAKSRLSEIASHTPSDSELSEALNIQLKLQAKVGKDTPDPSYVMLPYALRIGLAEMVTRLKAYANNLKLLTPAMNSNLAEYCNALSTDFFLDDLKSIGSNGGIINKIHKALVALKKKELETALERPSQRIIVESKLLQDSRISEFVKQWKTMHAEDIIDKTTGKTASGVFITSGTKKGHLQFQIQVGEANGHSIVIEDDVNTISLRYNDHESGRVLLLQDILQRVGFQASKHGESLTATVNSTPSTYATLAKIIPNMIDLDYVSGFQGASSGVREVAIQGILAGYPVTLRRTTATTNIDTYKQAYEHLTGKKAKKTKASSYAAAQNNALPAGAIDGLYPPGTVVWIEYGEGYEEETPLNPQETLYYDKDYLYIKSLITGSTYTKTPSKVTHVMPPGGVLPKGASAFKLKDGSSAYTVSPAKSKNTKKATVKSSPTASKAVTPISATPGAVGSMDDIVEGEAYIILSGNNAGMTVKVVKKINDNAVLVELPSGKKAGKYWFNLGNK